MDRAPVVTPAAGSSPFGLPRRLLLGLLVGVSLLALLARSGAAATVAIDPPANIAVPATGTPAVCTTDPTGAVCESAAVSDLDAARAEMGLGPYRLPADFVSLSAPIQLFILANLDRIAYGVTPLTGLNGSMDAAAALGVTSDSDPSAPARLAGDSWASNWAGGYPNALFAYFAWVYDDGYGSDNEDCTSPDAPLCWGHRNNIIEAEGGTTAAMGDAVGNDPSGMPGYALEIVSVSAKLSYRYTWSDAVADGAGGGSATALAARHSLVANRHPAPIRRLV